MDSVLQTGPVIRASGDVVTRRLRRRERVRSKELGEQIALIAPLQSA